MTILSMIKHYPIEIESLSSGHKVTILSMIKPRIKHYPIETESLSSGHKVTILSMIKHYPINQMTILLKQSHYRLDIK